MFLNCLFWMFVRGHELSQRVPCQLARPLAWHQNGCPCDAGWLLSSQGRKRRPSGSWSALTGARGAALQPASWPQRRSFAASLLMLPRPTVRLSRHLPVLYTTLS